VVVQCLSTAGSSERWIGVEKGELAPESSGGSKKEKVYDMAWGSEIHSDEASVNCLITWKQAFVLSISFVLQFCPTASWFSAELPISRRLNDPMSSGRRLHPQSSANAAGIHPIRSSQEGPSVMRKHETFPCRGGSRSVPDRMKRTHM